MNKNEFIAAIAEKTAKPKGVLSEILAAASAITATRLKAGEEVVAGDLGKLSTVKRAARLGRNPQTGEAVEIAAKTAVKFKASKVLVDAVA